MDSLQELRQEFHAILESDESADPPLTLLQLKLKAEAESLENDRKQLLDSKKLVEECNLLQQKWEEEKRELEQERLKWLQEIQEKK